jgi:hypothetical protein
MKRQQYKIIAGKIMSDFGCGLRENNKIQEKNQYRIGLNENFSAKKIIFQEKLIQK